jgi:hypothetical protein
LLLVDDGLVLPLAVDNVVNLHRQLVWVQRDEHMFDLPSPRSLVGRLKCTSAKAEPWRRHSALPFTLDEQAQRLNLSYAARRLANCASSAAESGLTASVGCFLKTASDITFKHIHGHFLLLLPVNGCADLPVTAPYFGFRKEDWRYSAVTSCTSTLSDGQLLARSEQQR